MSSRKKDGTPYKVVRCHVRISETPIDPVEPQASLLSSTTRMGARFTPTVQKAAPADSFIRTKVAWSTSEIRILDELLGAQKALCITGIAQTVTAISPSFWRPMLAFTAPAFIITTSQKTSL
ncbi:hypothetical protein FRC20_003336 [Serendipita sp. 405]|nr:hypothetical protein FRC15_004330 [Serendipita sp. 397]KAG8844959.1 hypothetical protein FRC20_003336 [Serendipita sp. 405]